MSEWQQVTLQSVVSILGDGLHGTPIYDDNGEYFFINGNNLNNGKILLKENTKKTGKDEYEKYKKDLNDRTIFVSINGTLGNVALYNNEKCFLGKSACYFNVKKEVDKFFIRYVVTNWHFQTYISEFAHGTTIKNVSLKTIREYPFLLPSLPEQKAIATVLSSLDDKIDLLHRQNKTLEAMAETLFRQWFVVEAQDDWKKGTLDDYLEIIIDYRGKTPKKLNSDWSLSGIPALSAKNIKNGKLVRPETFKYVDSELYQKWMKDELQRGDILMTSEAPLGELYFLNSDKKFVLSQRLFALRVKENLSPYFLYLYLSSNEGQHLVKSRASGTTVQGIRQSELRKVEIIIPPEKLVDNFSDIVHSFFNKINENNDQIQTLEKLRDTLLPKLMSGEVRVNYNEH